MFPDLAKDDVYNIQDQEEKIINEKVYKIKYNLNLLLSVCFDNDDSSNFNRLMDILSKTEELEIFNTKVGVEVIDFAWE